MTSQQRRLLARARAQLADLAATLEKLGVLLELDDGPPLPKSPRGANGRWTSEQIGILHTMLEAGASHEQIASALGRTPASVAKRASRYAPKSRLQSLRLDDAVYAQLVELDERLKPIRGGKQVSALFCRAVELGLDFADDLHASSHLQSTDHKQTTVRIPPALLARVLAVGEQITMRPTVVMRSAARRGLPLLTAEVELELTAPAELEAAS